MLRDIAGIIACPELLSSYAYSVTKSGNGWAIAHIFGNQTLTLMFKIIKNLPSGGFVASGNMFDTNGHPSLNVAENFTFIQKK